MLRFPRPLQAGDLIAVTAPSSGVPDRLRARLDLVLMDLDIGHRQPQFTLVNGALATCRFESGRGWLGQAWGDAA